MRVKTILLGFVLLLVVIQFFAAKKNLSDQPQPNDIFAHYPASDSLKAMVRKSCYDCHSNNTTYPWYARVQPIGWWLANHIEEGKHELNFSEFYSYPHKKADRKLKEVIETVQKRSMPMASYTFIHKDAVLSEADRDSILQWAKALRGQLIQ